MFENSKKIESKISFRIGMAYGVTTASLSYVYFT